MSKSKGRRFWREGEEGSEKKKRRDVLKRERDKVRNEIQKAMNGEVDDEEGGPFDEWMDDFLNGEEVS